MPIFFGSGVTGLVYQTLWARQLHPILGTSNLAIATVLAAFMGGLALGGHWASRRAPGTHRPLLMYAALELGIGVYALAFPTVLRGVEAAYLHISLGSWFPWLQAALVASALGPPTAMMGATLPFLVRFVSAHPGARVGALYAVNAAGACAGTLACGFVGLPFLGVSLTNQIAAVGNLGIAAVVFFLARAGDSVAPVPLPVAARAGWLGWAAGIAGFSSLIYEVAWTRLLVLTVGASVYAFPLMLASILIGISIGGALGGELAKRYPARLEPLNIGVQLGIACLAGIGLYFAPELPYAYVWLFDAANVSDYPRAAWFVTAALAMTMMTLPAIGMGMAFPLTVRAAKGDPVAASGAIYSSNTIGSVLGALLAGFVFLPSLFVRGTIAVALLGNFVSALFWARTPRLRLALAGAVALVLAFPLVFGLPAWEPLWMTAGLYKEVTATDDHSRAGLRAYAVDGNDLLYYSEGAVSVVTVARVRDSGTVWMANNGKVEASTLRDMPTQVLVALLPFEFAESVDRVLVIGLASGITAGAVSQVPDIRTLEVVELEPAVVPGARLFDAYNHGVLDDPRTQLVINDARNHLVRAEPGKYQVIVSEPSNPWITGVSNLFTREFFELGRSRLAPGGVWAQWVQTYGMGPEDLRTLLATFTEVYPEVLLFGTLEDADLILIGSDRPLLPTTERFAATNARWPTVAAEFGLIGMSDPRMLLSTFVADRDGIRSIAKDAPLNTDDNARIEHSAPLYLHTRTATDNLDQLLAGAQVPAADVETWGALASIYAKKGDLRRSVWAMALAMEGDSPYARRALEGIQQGDWEDALRELAPPPDPDSPISETHRRWRDAVRKSVE